MPPRTPKACRVRGCRSTTTDPSPITINSEDTLDIFGVVTFIVKAAS